MQNANDITSNGIPGPNAIAMDGEGNLFVQNDYINVTVYGRGYGFAPLTSLLKALAPQYPIHGIALDNGSVVYGGNQAVQFSSETQMLVNRSYSGPSTPISAGFATTATNKATSMLAT